MFGIQTDWLKALRPYPKGGARWSACLHQLGNDAMILPSRLSQICISIHANMIENQTFFQRAVHNTLTEQTHLHKSLKTIVLKAEDCDDLYLVEDTILKFSKLDKVKICVPSRLRARKREQFKSRIPARFKEKNPAASVPIIEHIKEDTMRKMMVTGIL
ncbi:hypothetical protein DL98DRAFT_532943 [Cadophora sp. DSE1049]|nr:hypothetical protein DL98DRAFT_532943 [Cadophora sp. DSE1049]